jgi:hypothetical protein
MTRYVTEMRKPPKADWMDAVVVPTLVHPVVSVGPPVYTGLLDRNGHRILRVPNEVGFVPRREKP